MRNTHTSRSKGNPKKANKGLCLGIAAVWVFMGIWLAIPPILEKQAALKEQNRLLDSIAAGDGEITITPQTLKYEPDFYIEEPPLSSAASEPSDISEALEPVIEETNEPTTTPLVEPVVITGTGVLTIEKIDLVLPVVNGISNEQLKVAIGRVPETAEIGEIGNAVIAGHRSYDYGQYFNRLGELENGDIIGYTSKSGESCFFEVFEIVEIEPGDQIAFIQPTDESIITLYTCTPIRTATHRLLVRAAKIID